jgi:hypothetical protein
MLTAFSSTIFNLLGFMPCVFLLWQAKLPEAVGVLTFIKPLGVSINFLYKLLSLP